MYRLGATQTEAALLLMKGDDDVLFFLDQQHFAASGLAKCSFRVIAFNPLDGLSGECRRELGRVLRHPRVGVLDHGVEDGQVLAERLAEGRVCWKQRDVCAVPLQAPALWACVRFSRSSLQPLVWHLEQNERTGITMPADRAFFASFMIARLLYSLPGPWQDSQSRGGVRAA